MEDFSMTPSTTEIRDRLQASIDSVRREWPLLVSSGHAAEIANREASPAPMVHYKVFGLSSYEVVRATASEFGPASIGPLLRLAILKAIDTQLEQQLFRSLPEVIKRHHVRHLIRIASDADIKSNWLDLSNDLFQKEFGLASARLLAVGSQLVDPRCGLPRSLLLKGGGRQALRFTRTVVQLGGVKPYFQIHTHKFNLDQFNEEGWEQCYHGCAALYDVFPQVLGMIGASWFYDPRLSTVSPRLNYLRSTPIEGGAEIFYNDADEQTKENALSTSPTRRDLYEKGQYEPKSYMLVWGRDAQRSWSKRKAHLH